MNTDNLADIRQTILGFHGRIVNDANHRYRSWEHCYLHFQNRKAIQSDLEIENSVLHLGFYLASWGMYRPSSFLLQKDYKVHFTVVRELLNSKYEALWGLNVNALNSNSPEVSLLFDLAKTIKRIYWETIIVIDGKPKHGNASDILVTKILLGAMGCIPAYDRFFKTGVGLLADFPAQFGKSSYAGLIRFYKKNKDSIDAAESEIAERGMKYPGMKLIDMYFWSLGHVVPGGDN